jgi:hypothetical protein
MTNQIGMQRKKERDAVFPRLVQPPLQCCIPSVIIEKLIA